MKYPMLKTQYINKNTIIDKRVFISMIYLKMDKRNMSQQSGIHVYYIAWDFELYGFALPSSSLGEDSRDNGGGPINVAEKRACSSTAERCNAQLSYQGQKYLYTNDKKMTTMIVVDKPTGNTTYEMCGTGRIGMTMMVRLTSSSVAYSSMQG